MSEGGKLVDIKVDVDLTKLEGLSDSVRVFVKRISDEVGAFTKPHHVRRLAKAKADAAVIEAEGKVRLSEVQERGLRRMVIEEGKRQENIEAVATKAIPHILETAQADKIDADWLSNFFDKCRLASSGELQEVFAKLLAGETNSPQSISKRTVNALAQLDQRDALLFKKFCSFVWVFGNLTPMIFEINSEIGKESGINFSSLHHLQSVGLINFSPLAQFRRQNLQKYAALAYYGRTLVLEFPSDTNELEFGHVLLTDVGMQLAPIVGSEPSQEYYELCVTKFFERGIVVSSKIDSRAF